jgi:hypothetical protein
VPVLSDKYNFPTKQNAYFIPCPCFLENKYFPHTNNSPPSRGPAAPSGERGTLHNLGTSELKYEIYTIQEINTNSLIWQLNELPWCSGNWWIAELDMWNICIETWYKRIWVLLVRRAVRARARACARVSIPYSKVGITVRSVVYRWRSRLISVGLPVAVTFSWYSPVFQASTWIVSLTLWSLVGTLCRLPPAVTNSNSPLCIYVFYVVFRIKSNYFLEQH